MKSTKSPWRCRWCGMTVGTLRKPAYEMAGRGSVYCKACVDAYRQGVSGNTTIRTLTGRAVETGTMAN